MKLKDFQSSKFTSNVSGPKIFPSSQTHQDPISRKNKMKFKNLSPGNDEKRFTL